MVFEMRQTVFLILVLLSTFTFAFEPKVVQGTWAIYEKNLLSDDDYYFLNINEDWSGEFTRSLGHKPITRTFTKENVIIQNGYVEIAVSASEKMVLSAWVLPSGSGRLTGQLFMYKENGELFNMLYYPLELVTADSKLLKQDVISNLYQKYH